MTAYEDVLWAVGRCMVREETTIPGFETALPTGTILAHREGYA